MRKSDKQSEKSLPPAITYPQRTGFEPTKRRSYMDCPLLGLRSGASWELQIEYCRLSRAIHGWRKLSSEDRKNIERVFGKAKTREFFQYADEAEK